MPFVDSMQKIYVTIFEGKFAVRSSQSDPKSIKREQKNGNIIYERRYAAFKGKLKEISFRSQDFNGKQWEEMHLLIWDGADHVQIQMPFPSNYSTGFLRAIKNAPLDKELIFCPWRKVTNEKVSTSMYINIEGMKESVPWFFTKDTPNGLPDLEPYTIPGKTEIRYSDVKRNIFFKQMIDTEINPALRKIWGANDHSRPESIVEGPAHQIDEEPVSITEPIDDLPF